MRVMIVTFSIVGAFMVGLPASGRAEESYPWCTQGAALHCYYMTREQCEQTVDYHGFCVANPEVVSSPVNGSRRHLARGIDGREGEA